MEAEYSCGICGFLVTQKKTLAKHKKNEHYKNQSEYLGSHPSEDNGIGKFLCTQGNRQFSTKVSLARHRREFHEGITHPCRQCNKQFSQKGALATHQREVQAM